MPDRYVEAIQAQTVALNRVAEGYDKSHKVGRQLVWLMRIVIVIGLVLLYMVFFPLRWSQDTTHRSLKILKDATSQKTQQKNQQATGQAVANIIVCINNHTDRVLAVVLHQDVPPLMSGCPPDHLPSPTP